MYLIPGVRFDFGLCLFSIEQLTIPYIVAPWAVKRITNITSARLYTRMHSRSDKSVDVIHITLVS